MYYIKTYYSGLVKATEVVPLFIFMSQKEVLHLLPTEVDLVLIVALDCLGLVHRIVQGQQELLKALHYGRGWPQIHVMEVTEPDVTETRWMELILKTHKTTFNFKARAHSMHIASLTSPEWGCHDEAA